MLKKIRRSFQNFAAFSEYLNFTCIFAMQFLGVFDGPLYTTAALRQDYRRGIYMGITFCLFAMPMLSNRMLDSDQGNLSRGIVNWLGASENIFWKNIFI